MEEPKKITQELKNNKVSGDEFVKVLLYLKNKGLVNYKNLEIPMEISLTDKGMEFVVNELTQKRQDEFNKIVAFTASILALIGIYTFFKDLNLINNSNLWINYIFVFFAAISIGPIVSFIIKCYFTKE